MLAKPGLRAHFPSPAANRLSVAGVSSERPSRGRALQPPAQPANRLYGDLQRCGRGTIGVRDAVAQKAAQDALGIPFSQGEALCERREGSVVLPPSGTAAEKDRFQEAGRLAFPDRISTW